MLRTFGDVYTFGFTKVGPLAFFCFVQFFGASSAHPSHGGVVGVGVLLVSVGVVVVVVVVAL